MILNFAFSLKYDFRNPLKNDIKKHLRLFVI